MTTGPPAQAPIRSVARETRPRMMLLIVSATAATILLAEIPPQRLKIRQRRSGVVQNASAGAQVASEAYNRHTTAVSHGVHSRTSSRAAAIWDQRTAGTSMIQRVRLLTHTPGSVLRRCHWRSAQRAPSRTQSVVLVDRKVSVVPAYTPPAHATTPSHMDTLTPRQDTSAPGYVDHGAATQREVRA
jgi:hypothetical protein